MRKYIPSVYQIKATVHEKTALWKEVKLQTYFIGHRRIDYFIVIDDKKKRGVFEQAINLVLLTQSEKELFDRLEKDYKDVKYNLKEQATIVYDIRDSRLERVP